MFGSSKKVLLSLAVITGALSAFGQEEKFGSTPEEQEQCKQRLSLYREFRDQKLIEDAITPWREACAICPQSAKTLYTDGVDFYEYFYKKASTPAEKSAYADSIFALHDARIANFGEKGKVLGYKGVDMFKFANDRTEDIYKILKESISLEGDKTGPSTIDVYYRTMLKLVAEGKVSKSEMIDEYLSLSGYLDAGMKKNPKYEKVYESAKSSLDENFVKIAACSDVESIATERFNASPDDVENLRKLSQILDKRNCTDGAIFEKVAMKLNEKDPSAESSYALGVYYLKKGKSSSALGEFKKAIELCNGCDKAEDYYLAAGSAASSAGQGSTAANYARKVISLNPNNGKAYIIIADAIASVAGSCGDNELTQKAPYYLAVDYLMKAKSIDSSVSSLANQKIAAYKARFPDKKILFQYSWIDGAGNPKSDPIEIGCWVNESTKARL